MQLYKFRSLQKFLRVQDIIRNREFYMADWRQLNDPMEGHFNVLYQDDSSYHLLLQDFIRYKLRLKICAFSKTFSNILLWSHYADQLKGVAIGINLPKILIPNLHKVDYVRNIPEMDLRTNPTPIHVLTKKISIWSYEKEYRFISESQTSGIGEINKIYLGIRISADHRSRILELVSDMNIRVYDTSIDFKTNRITEKSRLL